MPETFISRDAVVDLTNCDREPIHIPGKIQPHGVLLAVDETSSRVVMASDNAAALFKRDDVLGQSLNDVLGGDALKFVMPDDGVDVLGPIALKNFESETLALAHRSGGLLVIEVEPQPASGHPRIDVRKLVLELHAIDSTATLLQQAATRLQEMTGFDRVMIYTFDREWNGEVAAESKREDLEPFLGLHYPASDIPTQARELYRRNWIRSIADVDYKPAVVEPTDNPLNGEPLDMSHSTLRSVSPIHLEYLRNMGVTASMSVSLIVDAELWGLIACHHYSGSHRLGYEARLDAEFIGQALSLHISSLQRVAAHQSYVDARQRLEAIRSNTHRLADDLRGFVVENGPDILGMVEAEGAVLRFNGHTVTYGSVPEAGEIEAFRKWAARTKAFPLINDRLTETAPELEGMRKLGSGVLAFGLSVASDDFVAWFRPEMVRTVSWGGNPDEKPVVVEPSGVKRLSPRGSFELWKTTVERQAVPWDGQQVTVATDFARLLVTSSIKDAEESIRLSRLLQRSLLPKRLIEDERWEVMTHLSTGDGGRIGGDWYDVIEMVNGSTVVVIGDVTGHGIEAAATMGQLRSALRAYLFENADPAVTMSRLNNWMIHQLPEEMATCLIARLDTDNTCTIASAGHIPPVLYGNGEAFRSDIAAGQLLGLSSKVVYDTTKLDLSKHDLMMFTDGFIERRSEGISAGIDRLCQLLRHSDMTLAMLAQELHADDDSVDDDVTAVSIRSRMRDEPGRPDVATVSDELWRS